LFLLRVLDDGHPLPLGFERYIRKNTVLLHTLILSRTSHYNLPVS